MTLNGQWMWVQNVARKPKPRNLPYGVMAANGLNFAKSVGNPKSRLSRLVKYLRKNGPTDKVTILREVFGQTVGKRHATTPNLVTRGWGAFLFGYGRRAGFLRLVGSGNKVKWDVGPKAKLIKK